MSALYLDPGRVPLSGRPLLIVDADEVLLLFVAGISRFLESQSLFLDLSSYRLHGNIRRSADRVAVGDAEVTALLDSFRRDLDSLDAVAGARESLARLAEHVEVVALSNISPAQGEARLRNFEALGFDFPLVINSGPKGPTVRLLTERGGRPAFFIDDIPQQLQSAAEHAPEVLRIHLIGDERLRPLLPPAAHANFRAQTWDEAERFIMDRLNERKT